MGFDIHTVKSVSDGLKDLNDQFGLFDDSLGAAFDRGSAQGALIVGGAAPVCGELVVVDGNLRGQLLAWVPDEGVAPDGTIAWGHYEERGEIQIGPAGALVYRLAGIDDEVVQPLVLGPRIVGRGTSGTTYDLRLYWTDLR